MQCPKCRSSAGDFNTSEGVVVNFCSGCSGLWFDEGELALYCETERDIPNLETRLPQAQPTAFMCPRCAQASLVELPYMAGEALRVDWCPSCRGAWLDAGELPKVELLATRFESYVSRLQRTISELQQAGYSILHIRNPDDAR